MFGIDCDGGFFFLDPALEPGSYGLVMFYTHLNPSLITVHVKKNNLYFIYKETV